MAINVAAGYPQLSGTMVPNSVWSGKLLVKFYESTVLNDISNTDYEGEIKKMGDKVEIRTTPSITIRDYVKGQDLQDETPDPDNVTLEIDRAKYFSFIVDDIDKFQSDIDFVEDWATDASEQMKISTDTTVLQNIYADAAAANEGATAGRISADINLGTTASPKQLAKTDIIDWIVDLGTVLDEQNAPEEGRWLVLPSALCGLLKKSDLKDASLTGDTVSVVRNGRLGMIDRFTIYKSNLLARETTGNKPYHVLAGQKKALSFAAQIVKTRMIESEHTFGSKVQGLNVYGFDVLKPEALVHSVVYK